MPALKSIYKSKGDRDGFLSELFAALYFCRLGYRLRSHRKKYLGVEVDLVLVKANERLMVEVKKVLGDSDSILSAQQARRLNRVLQASIVDRIHLAAVDRQANVEVYEDVLALD